MAAKKKPAVGGLHSEGIVDDIILPLARKGLRQISKRNLKVASKQFDKGSVKAVSNLSKSVKNTTRADNLAMKQGLSYKNKQAKAVGNKLTANGKLNNRLEVSSNKKIKKNKYKLLDLHDSEMFSKNTRSAMNLEALRMAPIKQSNYAAQSKRYRKGVQKDTAENIKNIRKSVKKGK